MGYGLILLVGLVTSVHCVGMCGGIALSQGIARGECPGGERPPAAPRRIAGRFVPTLAYNAGRVLSYTVIGGIVGGLGSVLSISTALRGAMPLVAGAFMAFLGIRMLGIFPALSRLRIRIPGLHTGRIGEAASRRGPFVIGLLNGLMPCGPLQTMQVYALGTGSIAAGAFSMFLFALGTVPLLAGLGAASSLLSASFTRRLARAGGALVVVLGLVMAGRGLSLFGIAVPRLAAIADAASIGTARTMASARAGTTASSIAGGAAVARINGGVQEVSSRVWASSYQPLVVQRGVPVRWTIEVKAGDLNGCNNPLTVPALGIRKRLTPGKNVVEFTPDRTGTLAYTCWMGMITSSIRVVSDLADASSPGLPPADASSAGRAAIAAGLAAPPVETTSPGRATAACSCCAAP